MRTVAGGSSPVRLVRLPGEPVLIRCSLTDISERQRYRREIERLACSDELTGLRNRRLMLDRRFTRDFAAGGNGSNLLLGETIGMIARNLGLECLAEGIESAEQFEHLKSLGGEFGQGYLLGRPMVEADVVARMRQGSRVQRPRYRGDCRPAAAVQKVRAVP